MQQDPQREKDGAKQGFQPVKHQGGGRRPFPHEPAGRWDGVDSKSYKKGPHTHNPINAAASLAFTRATDNEKSGRLRSPIVTAPGTRVDDWRGYLF
jgi:hypothetical protein